MLGFHRLTAIFLAILLAVIGTAAVASDTTTTVRFRQGSDKASYSGRISASDTARYFVGARRGQAIEITLRASNKQVYFNVLRPNSAEALFNGSVSGYRYRGFLPQSGNFVVEVYLTRAAARRGESSNYSLDITIPASGGSPSPPQEIADGGAGGPDNWMVSGVAGDDRLNVRVAPSPSAAITGRLRNGAIVRNLGCKSIGKARWCRISARGEGGTHGWTNGRFLREAGSQLLQPTNQTDYAEDGQVHDVKCKVTSRDCISRARDVCEGEFRTIHSESHAGGILKDKIPGPVTWYYLEYQCGYSDGRMPQFPFRGPHFAQEYDGESDFNPPGYLGSSIDTSRMLSSCKASAALAFGQRSKNVLVLPVERTDGGYVVYGQYPQSGPRVTTFSCAYNRNGVFKRVRRG